MPPTHPANSYCVIVPEIMEDLFRQLVDRAEAPGGEDWLRSCLSQPSLRSAEAGSSGPEVAGADVLSSERCALVPVPEEDSQPGPSKRVRKHRRPYSPPGRSQARGRSPVVAASHRLTDELPGRRATQTVSLQQLEPPLSSAAGGEMPVSVPTPPPSVSSTVLPPANLSILSNVLSQLLQMCNTSSAVTSPVGETVTVAPVSSTGNVTVAGDFNVSASGGGNTHGPHSVNFIPSGVNLAAVWAGNPVNTATSAVAIDNPIISKSVSETCYKEAMMCEVSPLGYHLSLAVKEKIWKQDFVDILSLLPSAKEVKSDKKSDTDKEEERKRLAPRSFYNWVQAYCIFASIMGEKHPQLCTGLFRHLDIILEAYRNFPGNAWLTYDEMYRQKMAVHPGVKWGDKDVGLWLNLMLPQRNINRATNQNLFRPKGVCYAFNDTQCKWAASCRYRHECSHCAGSHPASKCFKKLQSSQGNPKESFLKGADSGDAGKASSSARNLPRANES